MLFKSSVIAGRNASLFLKQQIIPTQSIFASFATATSTTPHPGSSNESKASLKPSKVLASLPDATPKQIFSYMSEHSIHDFKPQPVRSEFLPKTEQQHNTATTPTGLSSAELEAIELHEYHRRPYNLGDRFALGLVRSLRVLADTFFRHRYVHRAVVLETVAAVPGMVAGMARHLRSLRKMAPQDDAWIEKLLREAESERMHLMIWMAVCKPSLFERMLVAAVQAGFFTAYSLLYVLTPRVAHRMVGYLEEQAVISYTGFLQEIRAGRIADVPAPKLAIDYYNLDAGSARLSDVVMAVRADEGAHRDANHHLADKTAGVI